MSAVEALKAARAAGVELALDGDDLVLKAASAPPAAVLDALSRHKAEIMVRLRPAEDGWSAEDWQVFFEKRAGIVEFDGGLPRPEAEARAFACCVVEWLNRNPERSPAGRCLGCGHREHAHDPLRRAPIPLEKRSAANFRKEIGRVAACGSGKSFVLACIAIFLACFRDWRPFLGPGEVGTIMIIAADRRQARVIMRYCLGLLCAVPMLKQLIEAQTAESITLRNRIMVEIHTASFKSTRGYTVVAALLDELAYWPTDEASTQLDAEIISAIKPGLSTVPGSMLLAASSPHARCGALWDAWRKHYGKDGDPILVWQAATREMNASVPQSIIDAALEEDPPRAGAENDLKPWRKDIWCIPQVDAEYVARMEDVLDLYAEPPDPKRPVICFDESPIQLIGEVRSPIPAKPGQLERCDCKYRRNGTANLFVFLDVHWPWRKVKVTTSRAAVDFAVCMRELAEVHLPAAERIRVVLDNLSTHSAGALYQTSPPDEARRVLRRLEFPVTFPALAMEGAMTRWQNTASKWIRWLPIAGNIS
jgi:hypothetical protein